jgi:hypothetical protein
MPIITAPLTPETEGLIGEKELALLHGAFVGQRHAAQLWMNSVISGVAG